MKKTLCTFTLLAALIIAGCNNSTDNTTETTADTTASTATPASEPAAPPMDSAAQAKAWEAYMTPGDMHKWLGSTDGVWSGNVSSWMSPNDSPMVSTATVTSKMTMGGRYQESIYKGTMMGMPFEGKGVLAYDNAKKVFVSTWIDNMGTGVSVMEGKMDDATKTINFEGMMTDPTTGKDAKVRQVAKFPDVNTQVMEMYCDKDGKEMKMMEMTLTKK
jgi:hypothetical protein